MMKNRRQGFMFIELAITLVFTALIIGGILIGKEMMRHAQVQTVIVDITQYKNAIKLFSEKYGALPGDMNNAASFWGSDAAAVCLGTTPNLVPKAATCNGNGDGVIGDSANTNAWEIGSGVLEAVRVWQHLANAGLIQGRYSGALADLDPLKIWKAGINTPKSSLATNGFSVSYLRGSFRHILVYGDPASAWIVPDGNPHWPTVNGPGLTAADAFMIDTKMDDGKPDRGVVIPLYLNFDTCTTVSEIDWTTEIYMVEVASWLWWWDPLFSSSNPHCALAFSTGL